jgi:hypothetical protein
VLAAIRAELLVDVDLALQNHVHAVALVPLLAHLHVALAFGDGHAAADLDPDVGLG